MGHRDRPKERVVHCCPRQGLLVLGLSVCVASILFVNAAYGNIGAEQRRLDTNLGPFPYVPEIFTEEELRSGACIFHLLGTFYMFLALAIVCDAFFVPALEQISDSLQLTPDVAGATFMAAGGSAPELFTSLFGYNVAASPSTVGLGTILGSAVFNVLFVIGVCALVSPVVLELSVWPLARDATFYIIDLLFLTVFFLNGKVEHHESFAMLILYIVYAVFMAFSEETEAYFYTVVLPRFREFVGTDESPVAHVSILPQKTGSDVPMSQRSISARSQGSNSSIFRRHSAEITVPDFTLAPANRVSVDAKLEDMTSSASTLAVTSCESGRIGNLHTDGFDSFSKLDARRLASEPSWKERTEGASAARQHPLIRRVQSLPIVDSDHGQRITAWGEIEDNKGELSSRTRAQLYGSRKSVSGGGILHMNRVIPIPLRQVNGTEVTTQFSLRARIMTNMYRTGRRKSTLVSISADAVAKVILPICGQEPARKVSGTGEAPEEITTEGGLRNVPEENEEEDDEAGLDIRCPTAQEGVLDWVKFVVTLPLFLVLAYTIPDVRRPERRKWYLLSFVLSILWIAGFTFLMLVWSTTFARVVGVPDRILGLTILASGTSVPDLITSVIVSKQGHGDMAVSSSIGSNIFDITVGLPIPWIVYYIRKSAPVELETSSVAVMWIQSATLMAMVTMLVASVKLCNWQMNRKLGYVLFTGYFLFLGESVWIESL